MLEVNFFISLEAFFTNCLCKKKQKKNKSLKVTMAKQTKKRLMITDEEAETEVRSKNIPAITDYHHITMP